MFDLIDHFVTWDAVVDALKYSAAVFVLGILFGDT